MVRIKIFWAIDWGPSLVLGNYYMRVPHNLKLSGLQDAEINRFRALAKLQVLMRRQLPFSMQNEHHIEEKV